MANVNLMKTAKAVVLPFPLKNRGKVVIANHPMVKKNHGKTEIANLPMVKRNRGKIGIASHRLAKRSLGKTAKANLMANANLTKIVKAVVLRLDLKSLGKTVKVNQRLAIRNLGKIATIAMVKKLTEEVSVNLRVMSLVPVN